MLVLLNWLMHAWRGFETPALVLNRLLASVFVAQSAIKLIAIQPSRTLARKATISHAPPPTRSA